MINMTAAQFIDAFGGTTSVASLLGIKPPSVSGWRDGRDVFGIPDDKLIRLAPVAEARGIASRRDLRPDDWHLIWPEIADSESNKPQSLTAQARAAIECVVTGAAHA